MTYEVRRREKGRGADESARRTRGKTRQKNTQVRPKEPQTWEEKLRAMIPPTGVLGHLGYDEVIYEAMDARELKALVEWVYSHADALEYVRRWGAGALVALHETNYSLERAKRRMEMFIQPSAWLGEEEWQELVALRASTPEGEDKPVIVALLAAARRKLVHVNSDEVMGEPKPSQPDRIATGCHLTTRLLVHTARALKIPAEVRHTREFGPDELLGGHRFPWFPSIEMGLIHGDDPYGGATMDFEPGELLRYWSQIQQHWGETAERRKVAIETVTNRVDGTTATGDEEFKARYLADNEAALKGSIVVVDGATETFKLTLYEIVEQAPAQLVFVLPLVSSVPIHARHLTRGDQRLLLNGTLRAMVEKPNLPKERAREVLPPELQDPLRLPGTREEARSVVIRLLRERAIKEASHRLATGQLMSVDP